MQHSENNDVMTIIIGGNTRCSSVEIPIPHEQENLIKDTFPRYLNEIEEGTWEINIIHNIDYNIKEISYENLNSRRSIQMPSGMRIRDIGLQQDGPIESVHARILIYNNPSDLEEYYRRQQTRQEPKIIRDIIVESPSDYATIEAFHQFRIVCRKYSITYQVLLCMSVDEEQVNHFETIREDIENNRPLSQELRYRPSTTGIIMANIRDTETHPRDKIPEILSESYILTIYNLWEQNYRGKIAKEQSIPKCKVKWDLMGELKDARKVIAHPTDSGSKPKVLKTLRKLWKMNESDNRPTPDEIVAKLYWEIDKANIGIDRNFNIRIE